MAAIGADKIGPETFAQDATAISFKLNFIILPAMSMNVNVGRLQISLHGVSAQMIEAAVQGLDAELGRRLGVRKLGQGLNSKTAAVDIAELALSPLHLSTTLDAAGLRGLIADRLLDAIETQHQSALDSTGADL